MAYHLCLPPPSEGEQNPIDADLDDGVGWEDSTDRPGLSKAVGHHCHEIGGVHVVVRLQGALEQGAEHSLRGPNHKLQLQVRRSAVACK
jgi:hypothetical protein